MIEIFKNPANIIMMIIIINMFKHHDFINKFFMYLSIVKMPLLFALHPLQVYNLTMENMIFYF